MDAIATSPVLMTTLAAVALACFAAALVLVLYDIFASISENRRVNR